MMTLQAVVVTVAGLDRAEVEGWIAQDLVHPAQDGEA